MPSRFHEGDSKRLRYLAFETPAGVVERETFYLLSTTHRLESFAGVGALPDAWQKLEGGQLVAIRDVLHRHVGAAASAAQGQQPAPSAAVTRDVEMPDALVSDTSGSDAASAPGPSASMGLSRLMLLSVGEREAA